MSDLSLKQMRDHLTTTPTSSSSVQRLTRSVSTNSSSSSNRAVRGGLAPQQLFTNSPSSGSSNGTGPLTSGLVGRPSTSQSLLMRYAPASTNSSVTVPASGLSAYHSTRSALTNKDTRPASLSSSTSSSQGYSSREAALGALLNGSIASLRATLHTDKVAAANRPKVQPQGVVSQSSDFIESGWRSNISAGGSAGGAIGSLGSSTRPGSSVARVLAPNGQPRKVPVAALAAMMPPPPAATAVSAGKLQGPGTPQHTNVGRLAAYYTSN